MMLGILIMLVAPGVLGAQSSTEKKALSSLKKIFGDSIAVVSTTIRLSSPEKDTLGGRVKHKFSSDSVTFYLCKTPGKTVGYGFVDNVRGKTQFITYMVALNTRGEIMDIDVLVYRESYGGEIAYESFRKQFRNKTTKDRLQPGRDIKNISGATISVQAISDGVKRILSTFEVLHPRLKALCE